MREYGTDVTTLAYSYVRNYHAAQDIAQDVFMKAFEKAATFRGDSSVKTWLLTITANRARDYLRSWSFRNVRVEEPVWVVDEAQTEAQVAARLENDALWRCVHQLPVKYREVIVLFYQRELSSAEVAQVLGITEQAVRTRLHRGREMLKSILGDGGLNQT